MPSSALDQSLQDWIQTSDTDTSDSGDKNSNNNNNNNNQNNNNNNEETTKHQLTPPSSLYFSPSTSRKASTASIINFNYSHKKLAGVMVPLACLYGEKDHYHGIGDFQSLLEFGKWSKRTIGTSIIQLLPLNELSDGDVSPYGALSSFGLEPLYLSLPRISELSHDIVAILNGDIQPSLSRSRSFDESELIKQLGSQETRDLVQKANSSSKVLVDTVRQIKVKAFWLAYYRFIQQYPLVLNPSVSFLNVAVEEDAKDFAFFCVAENEWLHHYALFRAIKDEQYSTSGPSWESWPLELRERHPQALHEATLRLFKGYNFYRFIQWKVQKQLLDVKQELNHIGVELMGDMPFGVARNSVDVWAHRDQFDLSLVAGSPPDPMNPAGQNWGLPAFHWQRMRNHGFYWLRARTRRLASLYDRLRIDHILGYFRTYVYPCDQSKEINTETGQIPSGFCIPDKHEDMIRQGEEVLRLFLDDMKVVATMPTNNNTNVCRLIGETLGPLSKEMYDVLAKLEIPPFLIVQNQDQDPTSYPLISLSSYTTHDMNPLKQLWEEEFDENSKSRVGHFQSISAGEWKKEYEEVLGAREKSNSRRASVDGKGSNDKSISNSNNNNNNNNNNGETETTAPETSNKNENNNNNNEEDLIHSKKFSLQVQSALIDCLAGSSSELIVFLLQDILGTPDRINTPGLVKPENWITKIQPIPLRSWGLKATDDACERILLVRKILEARGRLNENEE